MKYDKLKKFEGRFGLLKYGKTSERNEIHGKIKLVDDEVIMFKTTARVAVTIKIKDVVDFEEKEMLPEPTDKGGREIYWDGGIIRYRDNNKEVDFKR